MERREFLQLSSLATAGLLTSKESIAAPRENTVITIAHTNDVHSRLDPFPMDGSKLQGLGGISARKKILNQLRKEKGNLLLLDCGDMFQGTPYFNLYKGEPELKAMSYLGYDAGTLGNHDFDGGIENLATQLRHANFPLVNANYDFNNTALEDKIAPFIIKKVNGIKVGIIGVGIELKGLVPDALTGGIEYNNPITIVNELADKLKRQKKCELVIILSHLGYEYKDPKKIDDITLARETTNVDAILGGHTHTFLDQPTEVKNAKGKTVFINQAGWAGVQLGLLEFDFFHVKDMGYRAKGHSGIFVKETSV
jgi:5'-nucleotidase